METIVLAIIFVLPTKGYKKHLPYRVIVCIVKGKGKAVPLQAWTDPEGSRKLRFPDFVTTAQDGGKIVSLTHRPPLPPRKYSWYSFLLEAESSPGPSAIGRILCQ